MKGGLLRQETYLRAHWLTLQHMAFRIESLLPERAMVRMRHTVRLLKERLMLLLRPDHSKPFAPRRYFTFQGKEYAYLHHRYNHTWRNERAVEVPIVWEIVREWHGRSILEVGNVLSHYYPVDHDVVDKYERGPGIINQDVVDFRPGRRYDLIVSVSTLEHVGWEGVHRDPEKGLLAFQHLAGLLAPDGVMVITMPIRRLWVNSRTINYAVDGTMPFTELYGFMRTSRDNEWLQVDPLTAIEAPTGGYFFSPVNAFLIGLYEVG